MTTYRLWPSEGRLVQGPLRCGQDAPEDDPVIIVSATFLFDGHAEYEEYRVDGELVDVRVSEPPTSVPEDSR